MDEEQARKILGDWIQEDESLMSISQYLSWDGGDACLDAYFSLDELKAIVWWMENKD